MALSHLAAANHAKAQSHDATVPPFGDVDDAHVGIEPAASNVVSSHALPGLKPTALIISENVSGTAAGLRDRREQRMKELNKQATSYGGQHSDAGDSSPGTIAETLSPTRSTGVNPAV